MDRQLYCGAAKKEITPAPELLPYMFGLAGQRFGRVHDALYLRVLALQSGDTRAFIVVYDLDKAPYPEEWTRLLEEATGVPANNILYLSIHTHTAPVTGYRPFEVINFIERKPLEVQENVHKYEDFLRKQLLTAAKEAVGVMVPARMGYAVGECHIGINRCCRYYTRREDGTVAPEMNIGVNRNGIVDPTLLMVRFENAETGKAIAFFTNYAVHCVATFLNTCDDGKGFISSDIGGTVSKEMEKEYPGAVALWTSAPAGDVNPLMMVQNVYPDPATGSPVQCCIVGEQAADAILKVMACRQLAAVRETLSRVICDTDSAELRSAIQWAVTRRSADGFASSDPVFDEDYEIRLHLLQIGNLALIGVDGELYTSLGQAMKTASGVKDTFVLNHECSMLLNNPGYVMDDDMIARLKACEGRGSQRGGIPGGNAYTCPGTVKTALEEAVRRMFQ